MSEQSTIDALTQVASNQKSTEQTYPDKWEQSGMGPNREPLETDFRNSREWQQTQVETWPDTSRAIASHEESTLPGVSITIRERIRIKDRKYPANLLLNRDGDEPCLPSMDARGIVWRRIMACMPESQRPDYYYGIRENAMENAYNNHSFKLGNICLHVLTVADVDYQFIPLCPKVDDQLILEARVLAKIDLAILGLVLAYINIHHAWEHTYRYFYPNRFTLTPADELRYKSLLTVWSEVIRVIGKLLSNLKSKKGRDSQALCHEDHLFDSNVWRSYI